MSRYGVVTVGRLAIRENYNVSEANSDGSRTLNLSGQESSPYVSQTDMNRRREDILNSRGRFVAVTFSHKEQLNGYYYVTNSSCEWTHWDDHQLGALPWSMDLLRVGGATEIDLESKLGGSLTRLNNHAIVGERTVAPPIGHTNFYSGSTIATFVDRVSADGTIRVYRSIALNTNALWSCPELLYGAGRCRFIDENDRERTGELFRSVANDWEVNNGLVRVRPLASGGVIEVAHWAGGAWRAKNYDITYSTVSLGVVTDVSLLRNEPELVVVRLIRSLSGVRLSVDITVRRGSRNAELYVQAASSGTIKVVRSTAEASTAGTGFISATANDANGHRFYMGSATTLTTDVVNGGLSKAATVTFDVVIGLVVGGGAPATGDSATNLMAQYIGAPSESVQGVVR